jgi:hypothetical protein
MGTTGTTGKGRPRLTVTPNEEPVASAGTDASMTAAARIVRDLFMVVLPSEVVAVCPHKSISRAAI